MVDDLKRARQAPAFAQEGTPPVSPFDGLSFPPRTWLVRMVLWGISSRTEIFGYRQQHSIISTFNLQLSTKNKSEILIHNSEINKIWWDLKIFGKKIWWDLKILGEKIWWDLKIYVLLPYAQRTQLYRTTVSMSKA